MTVDEIVAGDRNGGTNTSHTIVVPALQRLLDTVDREGDAADYSKAVLDDNVLGKNTAGARRRTLRYLRELYLLRRDSILFRALRDLWSDDPLGQPFLAGLCAVARDSVFRASAPAIVAADPGDEIVSRDLAEAVEKTFPNSYGASTLAKIGRNTFSSWEQTGHLARGRNNLQNPSSDGCATTRPTLSTGPDCIATADRATRLPLKQEWGALRRRTTSRAAGVRA